MVLYDAPLEHARRVVDALKTPNNSLRWLHFVSAGREGFEAVGIPPGIAVTDSAGGASPAVAEHAMALLLALCRSVPEILAQQARRVWDRFPPMARAWSLEGSTMAIVGFGNVGREIARRARPFGPKIISLSRAPASDPLTDEARPLSDLHEVLSRADAIMVAIALAAGTRHLLDKAAFQSVKRGAFVVNVSRGGVIDQAALGAALKSGMLGGAGLDAMTPEPLPPTDPLWDCPNLILSPHFAGAGTATMARLAGRAAENLGRFLAGELRIERAG
jgi:phosphoglycerate dehydrogenase-like enzyme